MSWPIITPAQMYAAERAVFATGTDSFSLMRLAGEGVAQALHLRAPDAPVHVLCGPGGNGGDGFVAARWLARNGHDVQVYALVPPEQLSGDVARAAKLWAGPVRPLAEALNTTRPVTLDALFGGGLSRALDGVPASLAGQGGPVVSVDVPSGLDGLSARLVGPCFKAELTVTFAALRPAHVLQPGRGLCGEVRVLDIGVAVPGQVVCYAPQETGPAAGGIRPQLLEITGAQLAAGPHAANFIEALRRLAARRGRPLLLRAGETILALPDGRAVIDPQGIAAVTALWAALPAG